MLLCVSVVSSEEVRRFVASDCCRQALGSHMIERRSLGGESRMSHSLTRDTDVDN